MLEVILSVYEQHPEGRSGDTMQHVKFIWERNRVVSHRGPKFYWRWRSFFVRLRELLRFQCSSCLVASEMHKTGPNRTAEISQEESYKRISSAWCVGPWAAELQGSLLTCWRDLRRDSSHGLGIQSNRRCCSLQWAPSVYAASSSYLRSDKHGRTWGGGRAGGRRPYKCRENISYVPRIV